MSLKSTPREEHQRYAALLDCLQVLKRFGIDPSQGTVIDVGGTEIVYLDGILSPNPLLKINKNVVLLDKGFTIEHLGTSAHQTIDFLDKDQISHLESRFDLVFCFDTLEHVPNPFLFCENLIFIAKRADIFMWQLYLNGLIIHLPKIISDLRQLDCVSSF